MPATAGDTAPTASASAPTMDMTMAALRRTAGLPLGGDRRDIPIGRAVTPGPRLSVGESAMLRPFDGGPDRPV
ncbi:hypothetical protein GCM10009617_25700 [Leifsonia poae]|uniref:Uncharacterized protein n=1 Tax=Leifsonia poae TaxID=110933 RepID=A0A9W6HB34_9MICO|nr:hypothetical protein GCM10017584_28140 [Leifsonia poae]